MKASSCRQHQPLPKHRCCPVKHLPESSEAWSEKKRGRRAKKALLKAFKRHGNAQRNVRLTCRAEPEEIDVTAVENGKGSRLGLDTMQERSVSPSGMRPWSFLIPSMEEVATNKDWHLKVS